MGDGTFLSTSSFEYFPSTIPRNISCSSSGQQSIGAIIVAAEFVPYVLPHIEISVLGRKVTEPLLLTKGEVFSLTCIASGAKPAALLMWNISEDIAILRREPMEWRQNAVLSGLFDTSQELVLRLNGIMGSVICWNVATITYQVKTYTVTVKLLEAEQFSTLPSILSACAAFVCLLVVFLTIVTVYKRRRASSVRKHEYARTIASHVMCTSDELDRSEGGNKSSPRLKLPEVPSNEHTTVALVNADEVHYYSRPTESRLHTNVFPREHLSLVLPLHTGGQITRWMGNLITCAGKESVVVTTQSELTDVSEMERLFNWEDYVKNVIELQEHAGVLRAIGVAIDEGQLFLLQEYVSSGSLEAYLEREVKQLLVEDTICMMSFSSEIIDFLHQTLSGLEFLVAHGFAHPGLSLKKVLLNRQKTCKLYDFCLRDDAQRRVLFLKAKWILTKAQKYPTSLVALFKSHGAVQTNCMYSVNLLSVLANGRIRDVT
ncbi:putative tyrosine kinase receptor Cad96Ca isoform X2 [Apostichopus japonicus]|uniref:Putative tyrosine kinase receptor Cad96Ca isoform X2 n=1 Tax=Stichopus japonicus TaxID=307972 RepID=A0A2G8K0L7_STIJA|nr:putative tyrosine kinase receptor Cad96Ca isoform X2 [Apostichopus japonicus]